VKVKKWYKGGPRNLQPEDYGKLSREDRDEWGKKKLTYRCEKEGRGGGKKCY